MLRLAQEKVNDVLFAYGHGIDRNMGVAAFCLSNNQGVAVSTVRAGEPLEGVAAKTAVQCTQRGAKVEALAFAYPVENLNGTVTRWACAAGNGKAESIASVFVQVYNEGHADWQRVDCGVEADGVNESLLCISELMQRLFECGVIDYAPNVLAALADAEAAAAEVAA